LGKFLFSLRFLQSQAQAAACNGEEQSEKAKPLEAKKF